jgi:uncharacterized protein (TIGR02284 family)
METIERSVEVLNNLIEINNDRNAGFAHTGQGLDVNDNDLRTLFSELKEQSRMNVLELGTAINQQGGKPEMELSNDGTIHRAWLDFKGAFSGHDRKSILSECERGEDIINKAYQDAAAEDSGLSNDSRQLVLNQQHGIIASHNKIKTLRDSQF